MKVKNEEQEHDFHVSQIGLPACLPVSVSLTRTNIHTRTHTIRLYIIIIFAISVATAKAETAPIMLASVLLLSVVGSVAMTAASAYQDSDLIEEPDDLLERLQAAAKRDHEVSSLPSFSSSSFIPVVVIINNYILLMRLMNLSIVMSQFGFYVVLQCSMIGGKCFNTGQCCSGLLCAVLDEEIGQSLIWSVS